VAGVSQKSVRKFTWNDLHALSSLLNALGRHGFRHWPQSAKDLAAELRCMRLRPEHDIFLLCKGPDLCGYALTFPEPDISRSVGGLGVLPECAASAALLLDTAVESARNRRLPLLHMASQDTPADPSSIFTQRGFHEVSAILNMVLTRSAAQSLKEELLPRGFTVRPMAPSGETQLLTRVQNAVFAGQKGFSANSLEEIEARLQLPGSGPENVLFVETPEGEVAAYAWTSLEWDGNRTCGRVLMTGVMPGQRQAGLGSAVVQTGIKHLLAAGASAIRLQAVEGNNPAMRIYTRMGFMPEGRVTWFELSLT
jgi:mycothiol synthase